MSSTPYRPISFSPNETLTTDKLNQLTSNMNWLRDNTPRILYTLPSGAKREQSLRVASGRVFFPSSKSDSANQQVHFGNYFSAGCQPLITTGIVSDQQVRIFCTISGIGSLHPDNTGFKVHVNIAAERDRNDFIKPFAVAWNAVGY